MNTPKKSLREELDRLEREGYDKTKFCDAECALSPICDFCKHYDFAGGNCGCYLNKGMCKLKNERKDPHSGHDCKDFVCFRLDPAFKPNIIDKARKPYPEICEGCVGIDICGPESERRQ